MMLKYIEIRGYNLIQGFCFPPVELQFLSSGDDSGSPAPEPLDTSGDSIYTDTCEQFLSSGDDSGSPAPEPLDSVVNTIGDSCESWISVSQSCVDTWSIPLEFCNDRLVHL